MCTVMAGVMLVLMGLTGLGTAVRSFPAGDDRLHQRHRRADCLDADQGFFRPDASTMCPASSCRGWSHWLAAPASFSARGNRGRRGDAGDRAAVAA